MKITIKKFEDFTINELYDVLQLRSEVFVVEQDCVYQDIDGKDQKALHIIGKKEGKVVAYTRCFEPGYYFDQAAIGRVVVDKTERKNDYGHLIMEASITAIKSMFGVSEIKLSAQTYLLKFYESHGFKQVGEVYLEDGIPHIAMVKS
jgi:ElaA protein